MNNDNLREIEQGVLAAMQLSFHKLLQLDYMRDGAKSELKRIVREAIAQL